MGTLCGYMQDAVKHDSGVLRVDLAEIHEDASQPGVSKRERCRSANEEPCAIWIRAQRLDNHSSSSVDRLPAQLRSFRGANSVDNNDFVTILGPSGCGIHAAAHHRRPLTGR